MSTKPHISPEQKEQFKAFATARHAQGYDSRRPCCGDCERLVADERIVTGERQIDFRTVRLNPRCGIGGFAVLLTASCQQFERKASHSSLMEKA